MKSVVFGMFAVAGLAMTAQADVVLDVPANQRVFTTENASIIATPLHSNGGGSMDVGTPVYTGIPGPYFAQAAAGYANRDDYSSTAGGPFLMDVFKFVGGVAQVGGILDIFMLDGNVGSPTVISTFAVQLPQAGNFIWTITLGANAVQALAAGQVQIQTRGATTGQLFATPTAPSIGTNNIASGYGSNFTTPCNMAFEIQTPAPGSLALLGLGGLFASRRRR